MNNQMILDELDYYVVGHQQAKKALISLLTRSRLRHFQKYIKEMDDEFLISPMKILLIGPSGVGKTHLVESLQKIVHFPLVRVDATQMNPAGAGGGIKPNDLRRMVIDAAKDACHDFPEKYFSVAGAIDKCLVFVDEVDKLGTSFESSGNWNKHVQSNFLTMFDNKTEYAGLSFIFAGAFTHITTNTTAATRIGFNPPKNTEDIKLLDDELVKGGLIPEIVGRLTHIVELDRFDKDMYFYILKEKLLPKKKMDLAAYGVFDVEVPDDFLYNLADKASKSDQGVRYLHRALDMHFLDDEFTAGINYSIYNDYY